MAREAVHVVAGTQVYGINQFFDSYFRPDIITAKVELEDISRYVQNNLLSGIKPPPELSISVMMKDGQYRGLSVVKANDYFIENGIVKVKVAARENGGGVKSLRLFNNDKVVGEDIQSLRVLRNGDSLEQVFDVPLNDGDNNLRAIGFSDDMTESSAVTTNVAYSAPVSVVPNMYVLAIGINDYENSKYNLNYCVDDANGFVSALANRAKGIFRDVSVTTVLDRKANKANIVAFLDELRSKIRPCDVFVLFYAGHGIALDITDANGKSVSEFYYILSGVTQMTSPDKCAKEGISGTEMRKILAEIKATKQVLFVDACNSGAFANEFAVRGAAEENALAKLSRATGSVVFASTSKDQYATEFSELRHGVFTYVVLEALGGKGALENGQITAKSLMTYVEDKIPEYTEKYKGEKQYPTTFMWGMDFPIGMK